MRGKVTVVGLTFLAAGSAISVVLYVGIRGPVWAQTASQPVSGRNIVLTGVAAQAGQQCNRNKCNYDGGCASCLKLDVAARTDEYVTGALCYTNAHYPNDYPRRDYHEVPCNVDVAWSTFAVSVGNPVHGLFFNRSHNRERDVKIVVSTRPAPDIEDNTDRPQYNYKVVATTSVEECRKLCSAQSQCLGFVVRKSNYPSPGCFLKHTLDFSVHDECCTTGIVRRQQ